MNRLAAVVILLLGGCASEGKMELYEMHYAIFPDGHPCPDGSEQVWAGGAVDCIEVLYE